ncbi:MAG: OsmC family protein [Myxococcota bacterium]
MTEVSDHNLNGVDVGALLDARTTLEGAPDAAKFTWKATSEWRDGIHTRSKVSGFYGLGEEQARKKAFEIDTDHPEQFAAADLGATPVEIVLCGLAGCLTGGIASVAARRGITLRSVRASIEADMDLYGVMGIDAGVRNGFGDVRVVFNIDADADDDDILALVAQSQKRSAVFDIMANPTRVTVDVK